MSNHPTISLKRKASLEAIEKERPNEQSGFSIRTQYQSINEDALLVYFAVSAHNKMITHAKSDTRNEVGGLLLGEYCIEDGKKFVLIQEVIPCYENQPTSGFLRLPPEFWLRVDEDIEEDFPSLFRIGTYHTHPGIGIFLSGTDMYSVRNIFNRPHNVTIVVDPVQGKLGCFVWNKDEVVKTGCYLFD